MSMEEKDYIIRQAKQLAQGLGKFLDKASVNEILKQDEKVDKEKTANSKELKISK